MTYNINSHIESVEDVKAFFRHLVDEHNLSFHPDDMFEDYISCEGSINTFTLEECAIYNRLMDESFVVCEKANADIYEIGLCEQTFDIATC